MEVVGQIVLMVVAFMAGLTVLLWARGLVHRWLDRRLEAKRAAFAHLNARPDEDCADPYRDQVDVVTRALDRDDPVTPEVLEYVDKVVFEAKVAARTNPDLEGTSRKLERLRVEMRGAKVRQEEERVRQAHGVLVAENRTLGTIEDLVG
jgi:hypothetical protein